METALGIYFIMMYRVAGWECNVFVFLHVLQDVWQDDVCIIFAFPILNILHFTLFLVYSLG